MKQRTAVLCPPERRKILTCRALAHLTGGLSGNGIETVILEIALHVSPQRLREKLQQTVLEIEEVGGVILFGYGLCGRAVEGVASQKSTLILPRVDDCVGALLGSPQRHAALLRESPGCYFAEPTWIGSEADLFSQATRGMVNFSAERRQQMVALLLKNYRTLALLTGHLQDAEAVACCQRRAGEYGLEYREVETDLKLLEKLITGPWPEEEFVVCPPGVPIPLF